MPQSGWEYQGVDGSIWGLSDPTSPVQLSGDAVGNLSTASRRFRFSENAVSAGRRRTSFVHEARELPMTVTLNPSEMPGRVESIADAWWKAWSPLVPGRLTHVRPSGERRHLHVYHDADASNEPAGLDPLGLLNAYELTMMLSADDPIVYGEDIIIGPFESTRLSLYGAVNAAGEEVAPPFILFDEDQVGQRSLLNTGDLPAWPVWYVEGPVESYEFVLPGGTLSGAYSIAEGQTLIIDTRAGAKSAVLSNGTTRTLVTDVALERWGFAPVPVGESVAQITFAGEGRIRGEAVTGYERFY